MNNRFKKLLTLFCLPLVCNAMPQNNTVISDEDSNSKLLIRVRAIGVLPNESSSTITLIGGNVTKISDQVTPELDFNYFFTPNISAELILATAKHSVTATGTSLGNVNLGNVRLLPPTLTLLYHFPVNNEFSFYAGGGINYTHFFDVNPGPIATNVNYSNTFGGVLQVGSDFKISKHLSFNVDVKKVFIKPDVTVTALGLMPTTAVKINPLIVGVGIGFRP